MCFSSQNTLAYSSLTVESLQDCGLFDFFKIALEYFKRNRLFYWGATKLYQGVPSDVGKYFDEKDWVDRG
jgi:hypothetical protein